MLINSKSGCLVAGYVIKDATQREAGKSVVTKFAVRYGEEPPQPGEQHGKGKVLDIDCWGSLSDATIGIRKGNHVMAAGEMKSREYQGKTYYSMRAEVVIPDICFLYQTVEAISKITPTVASSPADISGHELYPGEQLVDHAPGGQDAADPIGDAPIDDTEDLPF